MLMDFNNINLILKIFKKVMNMVLKKKKIYQLIKKNNYQVILILFANFMNKKFLILKSLR